MASDPTQDPPQPYLCVFGTPGNDTIEISTTSITLNGGAAFSIPAGISEIHVHGEDGNDSLTEDAGVTPPVWYYGGDGNDSVSGTKARRHDRRGDAGPPELRADGPPTITEGQPATLALRRHWANATITDWYINGATGLTSPFLPPRRPTTTRAAPASTPCRSAPSIATEDTIRVRTPYRSAFFPLRRPA